MHYSNQEGRHYRIIYYVLLFEKPSSTSYPIRGTADEYHRSVQAVRSPPSCHVFFLAHSTYYDEIGWEAEENKINEKSFWIPYMQRVRKLCRAHLPFNPQ
jgi:hypothetical protein